ncbi:biopolymer transporter ExbD [Fulvitalea axinellae]|uniref:Biopolymer transporter ExbD n=1 Tax=Fulvitalea axinellae TaxID=1182444 RepID=A0AAU9D7T4_9BACT|nr:biopolymer transporter ExbD [Fulvitalea axinellae]
MKKKRQAAEVNAGSMADIAFLLLIFFLVTTTIASDKGIPLKLPPKLDQDQPDIKKNDRDIFKIYVNSADRIQVEDELWTKSIDDMVPDLKKFVLNYDKDPKLSVSPVKAVVSFKTDRGTSYKTYIEILDVLNRAYNEMYGSRVGLTAEEFRNLDLKKPKDKALYDKARKDFPKNISIAEPSSAGGN